MSYISYATEGEVVGAIVPKRSEAMYFRLIFVFRIPHFGVYGPTEAVMKSQLDL